jgi:hypothetical protein
MEGSVLTDEKRAKKKALVRIQKRSANNKKSSLQTQRRAWGSRLGRRWISSLAIRPDNVAFQICQQKSAKRRSCELGRPTETPNTLNNSE